MKFNIRFKLLVGFFLILILASLVQGFVYLSMDQYISAQIIAFQKLQVKKGANDVKKFFTELSSTNFSLARIYTNDPQNISFAAQYLLSSSPYIKKITILSPLGREIDKFEISGEIPKGKLSYEVYSDPFHSAVAGETSLSKVYYVESGLGPHIDLFSPIFDKTSTVSGIVKTQINLTSLSDELKSIKLGENGYVYVVDNEGRLVAHSMQSYVLKRPNLSSRKVIADIFNNTPPSKEEPFYVNEKGIPVVAQAVKIPGYNWIAVFEQPVSEAFGFITFIRTLFIITMVSSLVVLFILTLILSENLSRPIRRLQRSVQAIENGETDKPVIIKSGDEIESLSHSFASLIEKLFQREHALQKITKELQSANEKLQEMDKTKSEFVSVASHELRTPLTAIRSYLWMILQGKGGTLNEKQQYYIQRVFNSAERLIRLVNDMLSIARIESGRITIELQSVDLTKLIQEVIDEVNTHAREVGVTIIVQQSDPLPPVLADADKIKEVLFNLLGNSLKFTPKGGTITVSFSHKDGFIETKIVDTGSGIQAEDLDKLFQKFGLLAGSYITNQTATGTGLGLYICRSIIDLHHGKILAASEGRGKGATFTFTLKVFNEADMKRFRIENDENDKPSVGLIHTDL